MTRLKLCALSDIRLDKNLRGKFVILVFYLQLDPQWQDFERHSNVGLMVEAVVQSRIQLVAVYAALAMNADQVVTELHTVARFFIRESRTFV